MKRVLAAEAGKHVGEEILLRGWVHRVRKLGQVSFLLLRDRSGVVQTVIETGGWDIPDELTNEAVVAIRGKVGEDKRAPGGIEVRVQKREGLEVISSSLEVSPIEINKKIDLLKTNLDTVLAFRPLSLRNPDIRAIFKVQAEIIRAFREFLIQEDFTEIQTPKIVATGTEGGSQLFPVQYFERQAYLAQSPQFYKQIMVGSGFERVFEVGHAYRAEEHNTARHLNEYVSLDLEMGFIEDEEDIMQMETRLLHFMFEHLRSTCESELRLYKAKIPCFQEIPQITLAEAKEILKSQYKKDLGGAKDLDPEGERLICRHMSKNTGEELVYITAYPTEKRPFYTMPCPDHPELTKSFDLLYRGEEITTGGQRIHSYHQLVENMKKFALRAEDFDFYLQTFKQGMPPHGGLAIGAERVTKQLLNLSNIREASLFPRDRTRISP